MDIQVLIHHIYIYVVHPSGLISGKHKLLVHVQMTGYKLWYILQILSFKFSLKLASILCLFYFKAVFFTMSG